MKMIVVYKVVRLNPKIVGSSRYEYFAQELQKDTIFIKEFSNDSLTEIKNCD